MSEGEMSIGKCPTLNVTVQRKTELIDRCYNWSFCSSRSAHSTETWTDIFSDVRHPGCERREIYGEWQSAKCIRWSVSLGPPHMSRDKDAATDWQYSNSHSSLDPLPTAITLTLVSPRYIDISMSSRWEGDCQRPRTYRKYL